MSDKSGTGRRTFLKEVAAAGLALRGAPRRAAFGTGAGPAAASRRLPRKKNESGIRARIPAASSR